ncbi:MAG: hypothetical protein LWX52_01995 [Deltaproteobacteria bacterium]|jgi:hypothetical protein|nr:hypothetical protein [Deltaproteobacteria bacterium]
MSSENSKGILFSVIWLIMLSLASFSVAPTECHAFEITIDVAPNVLNLQNNGQVVTVHTNIAYGSVQASTVYMNNVAISSWKSDLCGNFVAKFVMNEIKDLPLVIDHYNTLTLVGITTSNESFWGSQDILVVDNGSTNQ